MAKRVLITGIAGGLARLVAAEFHRRGYEISGVDYRSVTPLGHDADLYQANYNKTRIEDVFRRHPPDVVMHLGRVGNLKQQMKKRFDLNVLGSRKVMDLALQYGAKRMVVLSTFHIYGAHPHNHIPIAEDEPLRAGGEFPEIADAIQLDNQAVTWAYQHPECKTAVLRPTNVVGPDIKNAISLFLRSPRLVAMMGFDPMVQFLHQTDLVQALLLTAEADNIGVFNVAGGKSITWHKSLEHAGGTIVPLPSTIAMGALRLARIVSKSLPPYLLNFLRYPCVISDEALREAVGYRSKFDAQAAISDAVLGDTSL